MLSLRRNENEPLAKIKLVDLPAWHPMPSNASEWHGMARHLAVILFQARPLLNILISRLVRQCINEKRARQVRPATAEASLEEKRKRMHDGG
jgi:hypothetical protein